VTEGPVVDLLSVLACAELAAYRRLTDDLSIAPSVADTVALGRMAVAEFGHFDRLTERLAEIGADPTVSLAPYTPVIEAYHRATAPTTWFESLVKAYVGDGIAADVYREIAAHVDAPTRTLVTEVLADVGHADFAVARVRAGIAADPQLADRLSLWARRLVGEAIVQAQEAAKVRPSLGEVLAGAPIESVGSLLSRVSEAHYTRMAALGLSA
jgi:hypothetical protein